MQCASIPSAFDYFNGSLRKCERAMSATLNPVELHVLWRETNNRVNVLAARVREGVDVMAASEFARWLQFSGVLRVLLHNEAGMPLPVRGRELDGKVKQLVASCGEWFSLHESSNSKPHPEIPRTELERINAQLAQITQRLNSLGAAAPGFSIIQGGG